MSKGITAFVFVLFVGLFLTLYTLTNRKLEDGTVFYYQPNYEEIAEDDFLIWSQEGNLKGYLKVIGVTKTGIPLLNTVSPMKS